MRRVGVIWERILDCVSTLGALAGDVNDDALDPFSVGGGG